MRSKLLKSCLIFAISTMMSSCDIVILNSEKSESVSIEEISSAPSFNSEIEDSISSETTSIEESSSNYEDIDVDHKYHSFGNFKLVNGKEIRQCACGEIEEKLNVNFDSTALTLTADINSPLNLSLLKKVSMYNAGTIDPISNYNRDIDLIDALNAESLRIDLSIGKGDGGRNYTGYQYLVTGNRDDYNSYRYNFDQLDSIATLLQQHDVIPYMAWCYVPTPLQQGNWQTVNTSLPNWKQAWKNIYYNYAAHYLEKGINVYHEIYNEPDLFGVFMNYDQFNSGIYNDMYVYGSKGIKEANPDATIGGPAFAIAQSASNTNFINAVKNNNAPMDFFSFHSYMDTGEYPSELNYVDDLIANDPYFDTTAIHINEFSWLNSNNGGQDGTNSDFNNFKAAYKTLDAIMAVVERVDVQWVHFAQFMESTCGADPYGLIFQNGHVKAAYNAIKMYNDMPVWRYDVKKSRPDDSIKAICSANDNKISYLIWNNSSSSKKVNVTLDNTNFSNGTFRLYRIDNNHASYKENHSNEALEVIETGGIDLENGNIWSGNIPAYGVTYLTINENGYDDFNAWNDRTTSFASDIKTQYYYKDRAKLSRVKDGTGSYSHFDRNSWTMYLSSGAYNDSISSSAIITKNLPAKFKLSFKTEGNPRIINNDSALSFRIDFYNDKTKNYDYSVLFHNGIYNINRTAALAPWGTNRAPDKVVKFDGDIFEIDLAKYAPSNYNIDSGKVQISYLMQNTGKDSRAAINLSK